MKPFHPQVFFNEFPVERSVSQKHLGLHLDQKYGFSKHINEKISKTQKRISVIKKRYNILPKNALLTIYKSRFRPYLDYGDIVFDQPNNQSESLSLRWLRRLCTLYKIKIERTPKYLYKLIPLKNNAYDTRSTHSVGTYYCGTNTFKYSIFTVT